MMWSALVGSVGCLPANESVDDVQDCRQDAAKCAPGFVCTELGGGWTCQLDEVEDTGGSDLGLDMGQIDSGREDLGVEDMSAADMPPIIDEPPEVFIVSPVGLEGGLVRVYTGAEVILAASSDDPEEGTDIPCSSYRWSSEFVSDALGGQTGCIVSTTFETPGKRTVRVDVEDAGGSSSSAEGVVMVLDAPSQLAPVPYIVEPSADAAARLPMETGAVTGVVHNPRGDVLTYLWTLRLNPRAAPIELSKARSFIWQPGDQVPFRCGGQSVTLTFEVSNGDETFSTERRVSIFYPSC